MNYVKLCEMPESPLDSIFILYNKGKLINSEEEKKMLLKRDNTISTECAWFYHLNEHKTICFNIEHDRSIESIGLIDSFKYDRDMKNWYDVKTLCYMENITIDDGELLNVDALLALAKREDANA